METDPRAPDDAEVEQEDAEVEQEDAEVEQEEKPGEDTEGDAEHEGGQEGETSPPNPSPPGEEAPSG